MSPCSLLWVKNGAVAGTYFNKDGNITLPLQGAIDESKQRVAWKIGEEDTITMETGLDSLTKDKSTVIIYFTEELLKSGTCCVLMSRLRNSLNRNFR